MSDLVLAGIDLTSMGRRVADRSRLVAETLGHNLTLLHVIEPVTEAMIDPGLARLIKDHQTAEAKKTLEWVAGRGDLVVDLQVVKGSPSWEITSRAKKAGLVVLGSSTLDMFTAGPITRRVSRMATTDVLVVRRQPRVPYRKVVVAVDFSESSRAAVERAMAIAPGADITVAYSLPSRFDPLLLNAGLFSEEMDAARGTRLEAAKDRMLEFAQGWNGAVRTVVVDGPPAETIEDVARRRGADLIVVGSRGATATRMVLLGTVAEHLIEDAPSDVLVARAPSGFRRP